MPQGFQTEMHRRPDQKSGRGAGAGAGRRTCTNITDDCALVHACGYPVKLVQGSPALFKITRAQDFALARAVLEEHQ